MAVWQFTKDGDISNGEYIISFQQLVETIERSNSNSINIDSANMGEMLSHNDLVYINQSNGKFYKSLNTGIDNQAQNVIGVYRFAYNKHQIVFNGIINGFVGLIPGKFYYLSDIAGVASAVATNRNVVVGRAVNSTTLLLDITGDIGIQETTAYDTTIVDGESKEGNGLTDPSQTTAVSFSKKTYDGSVPALIMFFEAGGVNSKLDFATEYTGDVFVAIIDDVVYTGAFAENEDYSNPTHLSIAGGAQEPPPEEDPINGMILLTGTASVDEGEVMTHIATVDVAPTGSDLIINLSNGSTITIPVGSDNGSVLSIAPAVDNDVTITTSIVSTSGGSYDSLHTGSTVNTLVRDVEDLVEPDPVNASVLLLATASVNEGETITYTAEVSTAPTSSLVINLSNGSQITIPTNASDGSVQVTAPQVNGDTNITVSITSTSGGSYDTLDITDTASTLIIDAAADPDPTYDTSLTDGQSADGIGLTDPSGTMTISFDAVAYDGSIPAIIEFMSANGETGKIDFAIEYSGNPFSVTIDGVTYSGVFAENEDYNNPTILS